MSNERNQDELRILAKKLAVAISNHDLPEIERLLNLLDGKPADEHVAEAAPHVD